MPNEPAPQATRHYRVLIVDDKPEMRRAFTNLLYFEEDFTVSGTAEDGAEAVKKAQELAPDIIIMDIEMPVLDGIAATRQIKQNQPTTLIVAVSSEIRHKTRALEAGANAFLTKPFTAEDLIATIRQVG